MNQTNLVIIYCSLWFLLMYLTVGTIAAAENRRIMIPLFITNKFFNKIFPKLLFIANIVIGIIYFKWYMMFLYAIIGLFLFFPTDLLTDHLYLRKKYGAIYPDEKGFYYTDYRVMFNFKFTMIGYLALFIFWIGQFM